MATFAQDANNDLALTTGQLTIVEDATEACAIKLKNRLQLFKSEWFLDQRVGIPYYEKVFVKNPDLNLVRQLFRKVLLATPPIVRVDALDVVLDGSTRVARYTFRAITDSGAVITGGSGEPFIVEQP